jgi:hypothetical protein
MMTPGCVTIRSSEQIEQTNAGSLGTGVGPSAKHPHSSVTEIWIEGQWSTGIAPVSPALYTPEHINTPSDVVIIFQEFQF